MAKQTNQRRMRKAVFRDARFIVIVAEGSKTEALYFENLAFDARYRHPRVRVGVLDKESTASSPKDIIKRLNKFKREYNLDQDDELWLVFDRDNWSEQMLSEVAQQAIQKNYHLADSNPCFEIWLLLHHKSLQDYGEVDLKEFEANQRTGNRTRLERELVRVCGSYNKSNPDLLHYIPFVATAIKNAKETDTQPQDRWLNQIGTRVYRLAQSIIASAPSAKHLHN